MVQNEINNMSFLISDTKSKMSKVFLCSVAAREMSPCSCHWLVGVLKVYKWTLIDLTMLFTEHTHTQSVEGTQD